MRPIHGKELAIVKRGLLPETEAIYIYMPEIQLFEVWLIVPRDKFITKVSASIRPKENNSKVNLAKCCYLNQKAQNLTTTAFWHEV